MISIIIPTYNNLEDLKQCIDSIKSYTNFDKVEVIIVANGCKEDTKKYLEEIGDEHIMWLWFDKPLGYAGANNAGLKVAKGDYIVLLNDDTILLPQKRGDWINMLLEPMVGNVGITAPFIDYSAPTGFDFAVFFCVMIKREVFNNIGVLNEDFDVGSGEDTEFCIRAQHAGYKLKQVPDTIYLKGNQMVGGFPIYHKAESTVGKIDNWQEIFDKNTQRLKDYYELPEGWFFKDDIKEYRRLVENIPDGGTLVELGVWKGRSLCSVSDIIKRKGIKVIAVDTFEGTENEGDRHDYAKENNLKAEFENNINKFGLKAKVLKMTTNEAVSEVDRADLVFIDADHSYEAVKQDIENWLPKTKVIAGHDYKSWEGVTKAVDELLNANYFGTVWSYENTL